MNENEFYLNIVKAGRVSRFEADEPGVTLLKDDFRNEAEEFLFLRKGEDFGAFLIQAMEALSWGPDIMKTLYYAYEPITDFAGFHIENALELDWDKFLTSYLLISNSLELSKKQLEKIKERFWYRRTQKKSKPVICILCYPDKRNERARVGWEALGAKVRHYKEESQKGSHRLYLNEKRYAMFYRSAEERFFGFIGDDQDTISRLKELFEAEWERAKDPKNDETL